MNRGKAKRRAIQAERKKKKHEGTWVTKNEERATQQPEAAKMWRKRHNRNQYAGTRAAPLFEFQRTIIGYVWEPIKKPHTPINVQVEVIEEEAGLA